MKKPYSIPKLHIPRDDRGKPIVKGGDWFVWFRYEGQKHPLKYRKDLNRIPTYRERKKVGQALAQVYHEMLKDGWNPLENKYNNKTAAPLTVGSAIDKALSIKENQVATSTYRAYKSHVETFKTWCESKNILGKPAEDLTRQEFSQFLDHIEKKQQGTSVNNHKRTINLLYNELVKKFILDRNPIAGVDSRKSKPKKNTPYSPDQLKTIIEYLRENDLTLLNYVRLMMFGFLRTIEVVRLKVGDIEQDVMRVDTKTDARAYIKIIDSLRPALDQLIEQNSDKEAYLITRFNKPHRWIPDEKSRYDHFQRRFKKVKDELGIGSDYGLYSFRHNAAFAIYRSFINDDGLTDNKALEQTSKIMRHKSTEVTRKYLRDIGATLPADYSHRFKFDL